MDKNVSYLLGIRDAFDPKAVLQLIPLGVGEVRIQGLESGLFLAMNSKGGVISIGIFKFVPSS